MPDRRPPGSRGDRNGLPLDAMARVVETSALETETNLPDDPAPVDYVPS